MSELHGSRPEGRPSMPEAPAQPGPSFPRPLVILLVDDDPELVELLRHASRRVPGEHVFHRVASGSEALDFLARRGAFHDAPRPDVMLLDLHLPGIAGLEVLSRVRSNASFAGLVTVVFSNSVLESDVEVAFELGAAGFVHKPDEVDGLAGVLERIEREWLPDPVRAEVFPALDDAGEDPTTSLRILGVAAGTKARTKLVEEIGSTLAMPSVIDVADSAAEARLALERARFDVTVVDLQGAPAGTAGPLLDVLAPVAEATAIVLLTSSEEVAPEAIRRGVLDVISPRPPRGRRIARAVRTALERHRTRRELGRVNEQLRAANERLEQMTLIDPLTELYNRRGMQQMIARESLRSRRAGDPLLAVIADLDDFKEINDRYGHAVGDHVLRHVAGVLRSFLRTTDVLARVGGDEFLFLLPETRLTEGQRVLERLREGLSDSPLILEGLGRVPMTMSLGMAVVEGEQGSLDELLVATRGGLAASKAAGKNRLSLAQGPRSSHLDQRPKAQAATPSLLEELGAAERFDVRFVSVLRLVDMRPVAREVRAFGRAEATLEPAEYLALAREAGSVVAVDLAAIEASARALRSRPSPLPAYLRVHPSTLLEAGPFALLDRIGDLPRLAPLYLLLEDAAVLGDPMALESPLRTLREKGLGLALEGVGFGRGALENVVLLEPDVVVLDARFIASCGEGALRPRSTLRLLRALGKLVRHVVAGGLISEEAIDTARALEIPYGRGRALPG